MTTTLTRRTAASAWCRHPRISWIIYIVLQIAVLVTVITLIQTSKHEQRYGIVFNAVFNQTLGKVYCFEWNEGVWKPISYKTEIMYFGLDHYSLEDAIKLMQPFFLKTSFKIPRPHRDVASVSLGFIGEMRNVPTEHLDALISQIGAMFRKGNSPFKRGEVVVVTDQKEVTEMWTGLVLLVNAPLPKNNVTLLHLNVYTSSVAFIPESCRVSTAEIDVLHKRVNLHVGTNSALGIAAVKELKEGENEQYRCELALTSPTLVVDECSKKLSLYLETHPIEGASELAHKDLFATGNFYITAALAGLVDSDKQSATISIKSFKDRAIAECVAPTELCYKLIYIYTLLKQGYKIPDDVDITVASSLSGYEISWSLGKALSYVYDYDDRPNN